LPRNDYILLPWRDERITRSLILAEQTLTRPLTEGLVITIEPIVAAWSALAVLGKDGWSIESADGGPAAHHEHTLVVTRGSPILLTAA